MAFTKRQLTVPPQTLRTYYREKPFSATGTHRSPPVYGVVFGVKPRRLAPYPTAYARTSGFVQRGKHRVVQPLWMPGAAFPHGAQRLPTFAQRIETISDVPLLERKRRDIENRLKMSPMRKSAGTCPTRVAYRRNGFLGSPLIVKDRYPFESTETYSYRVYGG